MAGVFEEFCAAGLWPGLGRTTAARLAGAGVVDAALVSAERLATVDGVTANRAARLAKSWAGAAPLFAVAVLLHPAGVPLRFAPPLVSDLGDGAARRLAADPWLFLDVDGVTPGEADRLALATLDPRPERGDPRRGAALSRYVLARAARDGHTAMPVATVLAALAGWGVPDPAGAVHAAVDDGRVLACPAADADPRGPADPTDAAGLLALDRYAMAEDTLAEGVARLCATAQPLCTPEGATSVTGGLDPEQRVAVLALAEHGVSVLTGGPGTGKSRTVAAIVALAGARGLRIELAAPTGRAAKRLEELTGAPAGTLHRLLQAQGRTGRFLRGEDWPLDADVVVVDEASMLDAELAAALVEACADGVHLLLVGDPAQLPSIGAGRVLGDVVESRAVPVTELTTLHRQAEGGAIARLAIAVRGGTLPPVDDPTREVVVVPSRDAADAARRVVQLVTDSIPRALGIAAGDVQVVTPVHRGAAGTLALNAALKAELNPGPGIIGGFDVGDRVVAVANHPDEGFANGEVGVVTATGDGALTVAFAAGTVAIPPAVLADLRHGWALTVHRAQGSEWPACVVAVPPEAAGMLSRPLVYTAFTRAQRHLSVVPAVGSALARAVHDIGARPRRTRLAPLLRAARLTGA